VPALRWDLVLILDLLPASLRVQPASALLNVENNTAFFSKAVLFSPSKRFYSVNPGDFLPLLFQGT